MEGAGAKQAACAGAGSGASDPGPPPDDPVPAGPRIEGAGAVPVPRDSGAERDAGGLHGVPAAAVKASCSSPLATGRGPAKAAQDAGLDPNSSFLLKMKLVSNRKKARKLFLERINKQQGPKAKKLCLKRTLTGPWGTTDISASL
ncbi:hypothetical protein EJB05_26899, partial [Eragrostis curvula]